MAATVLPCRMEQHRPGTLVEVLPVLLLGIGAVGLVTDAGPLSLFWLCAFAGVALHYGLGLRDGMLRTGFLIFRPRWTFHQAESPFAFLVAAVVEGLLVAGLFFAFIVSL